jgi:hypothetical protein
MLITLDKRFAVDVLAYLAACGGGAGIAYVVFALLILAVWGTRFHDIVSRAMPVAIAAGVVGGGFVAHWLTT